MKPKETLKRLYYALTSAALFIVLIDLMPFGVMWNRQYTCLSLGLSGFLLTLGIAAFCWLMSRHNGNRTKKWYIGAIPIVLYILWFLIVELLRWWAVSHKVFINVYAADVTFLLALMLCMAITAFYSKTRYDNILPIHNKVISQVLRWLFIAGQIAIWIRLVWILPDTIARWSGWPNETYVNQVFNEQTKVFDKVFNESALMPDSLSTSGE